MYGAINTLFFEKTLFPKAFLLHKLHTFLFNKDRNDFFSNTDSLALAQSWGSRKEISVFLEFVLQLFLSTYQTFIFFSVFSIFRGANDLKAGNNIQNASHKQKVIIKMSRVCLWTTFQLK